MKNALMGKTESFHLKEYRMRVLELKEDEHIKFLKQQTNILLDDFAKLQNESNIETTVTELNRIKRNRAETDYQLRKQMRELAQLKTSYAVDELYKQRKK